MKYLLFCLVPLLLYLTACQTTNRPLRVKDPLLEEQAVLDYFVDSIIPNDEHFSQGYNFEFDFVVRSSMGDSDDYIGRAGFHILFYLTNRKDSTNFWNSNQYYTPMYDKRKCKDKKNKCPVKMPNKKNWNLKKIKYTTKYFDKIYPIYKDFASFPFNSSYKIKKFKKNKVRLFIGSNTFPFILPSGERYREFRLQAIYKHEGILYDKSYYFFVKNYKIENIDLCIKNHTHEDLYSKSEIMKYSPTNY